jgi:hypothetical protein
MILKFFSAMKPYQNKLSMQFNDVNLLLLLLLLLLVWQTDCHFCLPFLMFCKSLLRQTSRPPWMGAQTISESLHIQDNSGGTR